MTRVFATNPAEPAAVSLQRNAALSAPPSPSARQVAAPTVTLNPSNNSMTHLPATQQGRDALALNELATLAINRALDALKANKGEEAASALRTAQGFADRFVVANAAVLTANARQADEFHDYDVNNPMGDLKPEPHFGNYDLNNL